MDNMAIIAEKALEFVSGLLDVMKVRCDAELVENTERIKIVIRGADNGAIIGYRGEALDAIQYLTLLAANRGEENFAKVVVDSEDYREKRANTLADLAGKLAEKAARTKRRVELEPMNPFERRVIHSALQDSDKATTISEGDGVGRHVVIIPKDEEKQAYDPYAPEASYVKKENNNNNDFKKNGFGNTRKFGYKKK